MKGPKFTISYEQAQRLVDELEPGMVAQLSEVEVSKTGKSTYRVGVNWIDGYREWNLPPNGSGYFDRQALETS